VSATSQPGTGRMTPNPDSALWHQAGVTAQGEPCVQLWLGDDILAQMDCEQARAVAWAILQATDEAEWRSITTWQFVRRHLLVWLLIALLLSVGLWRSAGFL
jgi:hypothetical protein